MGSQWVRCRIKQLAEIDVLTSTDDAIPSIISARGPKAVEAYKRALKFGTTYDKRVKVALIGRDRAGKTSLGRSLKGEPFNMDELSTVGMQMYPPIKNVGTQAWKNLPSQQHTTAFDHKCAELIVKEGMERSAEQQPREKSEELVLNEKGVSRLCLI